MQITCSPFMTCVFHVVVDSLGMWVQHHEGDVAVVETL